MALFTPQENCKLIYITLFKQHFWTSNFFRRSNVRRQNLVSLYRHSSCWNALCLVCPSRGSSTTYRYASSTASLSVYTVVTARVATGNRELTFSSFQVLINGKLTLFCDAVRSAVIIGLRSEFENFCLNVSFFVSFREL